MISRSGRGMTLYFIMFVFSLTMIIPNIMPSADAGFLVAQVQMDQLDEDPSANVAPGQSGSVTFHGKVVLTRYQPAKREQVFVTLRAYTEEDNDDWGASVFPPVTVFNPLEISKDIQVHVTAPMYEDVKEDRNVIIGGEWMASPSTLSGSVMESGVVCQVAPYIKFVVIPVEGYQRVWPGGVANFKVGVFNLGNRNESFHVSVLNLKSLSDAGVAVSFYEGQTITVAPFSQTEIPFRVEGTPRIFHPRLSHITHITLHIVPDQPIPDIKGEGLEIFAQDFDFFYYEFGPSVPDFCMIEIVIGVIGLVILYQFLKRRSKKRKKLRKKMRRRRKMRQQEEI